MDSVEFEVKTGNEAISRLNNEKENLNQAIVSYLTTIDLLKRVSLKFPQVVLL